MLNNMEQSHNPSEMILIYYNFKGVGQIIRFLLSYLQIPYDDIYLDEYETQKHTLSAEVRKALEEHPVSRAQLPAIIHQGHVVYELNQIVTYICRAFGHEELLGRTIQQKSRVCEFIEIYSHRLVPNLRFMISYLSQVLKPQLQGINLLEFVNAKYQTLLESSGYLAELTTYFLKYGGHNFTLGDLTVIDFYFFQGARQTLALFGCIDEETADKRWAETARQYLAWKQARGEQIQKTHILRGLKKYHQFFISQQFYVKKLAYFQEFNIVPKNSLESTLNGMRKIWAIDQKYQMF